MFGIIDNRNDSVTCVYSGFTIWLDPSQDPTQDAFAKGLNTEHTYPQSLGASGIARGDLHHLYPSRSDVNDARGNSPFAEIPDNETQEWYYLDQKLTSIPASNIDRYSERKGDLFEPREDHKGDVARAMFYFYTMYKEQADMANSSFFEIQRPTLCAWHLLDPVDEKEWQRTWLVAQYQEGKPNPFVLDCTLPARSYCTQFGQICTPLPSWQVIEEQYFEIGQNIPNPFSYKTSFNYELDKACRVRLEIYNALGAPVEVLVDAMMHPGEHRFDWERKACQPAGFTFAKWTLIFDDHTAIVTRKLVLSD
jgi:hypothetical protein